MSNLYTGTNILSFGLAIQKSKKEGEVTGYYESLVGHGKVTKGMGKSPQGSNSIALRSLSDDKRCSVNVYTDNTILGSCSFSSKRYSCHIPIFHL